jgi:hypothetical protein
MASADAPFDDGTDVWDGLAAQRKFDELKGELLIKPVKVGFAAYYAELGRVGLVEEHAPRGWKPVSINGREVGQGNQWATVQQYDVAKVLRAGRNEIVVRARNDGDSAGLIAELDAGKARVVTDSNWTCSATENGRSVQAEVVSRFEASLWFNHPMGPPRL